MIAARSLLALCLLTSAAGGAHARGLPWPDYVDAANPLETLHAGGDYDITIVGEGYKAEDQALYAQDVERALRAILDAQPFSRLSHRLSVHKLNVVSERRCGEPAFRFNPGTPLAFRYDGRAISIDWSRARALGALAMAHLGRDSQVVLVLCNFATYSGTAHIEERVGATFNGWGMEPVAIHELGHAAGGLGDEYVDSDRDDRWPFWREPEFPNLTAQPDPRAGKWARYADSRSYDGSPVACFEGGYFRYRYGLYRPTERACRMHDNQGEFCPVCMDHLSNRIAPGSAAEPPPAAEEPPAAEDPPPAEEPPAEEPPAEEPPPAEPPPAEEPLPPESLRLEPGRSIHSRNGRFTLAYQEDGNLVLYRDEDGAPLWSSGTAGLAPGAACMQGDGNLVVYAADGSAPWASHTSAPGSVLELQDDGNLVIYDRSGRAQWASHTAQ